MNRPPLFIAAVALLVLAVLGAVGWTVLSDIDTQPEQPQAADTWAALPQLPFEQFELDNGLQVLMHRDNTLPLVAVGLWYKVGSSREWRGRTGLAHLIEHLMFVGSQSHPQDYYDALEAIGGTGINGVTNKDRTSYLQTVPSNSLDRTLWLESNRMGWMLLDQDRLQNQLATVKNEVQQHYSQPYSTVGHHLARLLYPDGHPYAWPVAGFDEDLQATTLEDIERFRSAWYAPSNAVLVIAGDIDPRQARAQVERYFAPIPGNPQSDKLTVPNPALSQNRTASFGDRIPYPRLYRAWHAPAAKDIAQTSALYLACALLGGDDTSILHRRLVQEEQLANSATCSSDFGELGGTVTLTVEVRSAANLAKVRSLMDAELRQFLSQTPDLQQMHRIIRADIGGLLRSMQKQGGFSGRMAQLAEGYTLAGDANLWQNEMLSLQSMTAIALQQTAQNWLQRPWAELTVLPEDRAAPPPAKFPLAGGNTRPEFVPSPDIPAGWPALPKISLPQLPQLPVAQHWIITEPCPARRPDCQPVATDLYLIQRDNSPLLSMDIQFPCRRSVEELEPAGLAQFTTHMMAQGTETFDIAALRQQADSLSGTFAPYANLDYCGIESTFPAVNFSAATDLALELAYRPLFAEADLAREQKLWLTRIKRELAQPQDLALRTLPPLLYGRSHSYGVPFTGTGYAVQMESLITEDLHRWHSRIFRPQKASIIVAGDIAAYGRRSLLLQLEQRLGGRAQLAPVPVNSEAIAACSRPLRRPEKHPGIQILLIPSPDSPRSVIAAGQTVTLAARPDHPPSAPGACDRTALHLANEALGGAFASRYNLLFRRNKGWSYGAYSLLTDQQGPPLLAAFTSVPADRTAEAVHETVTLVQEFVGSKPLKRDEMRKARQAEIYRLPALLESVSGLRGFYSAVVGKGRVSENRPANWWLENRLLLLQSLRLQTIRRQAKYLITPDRWVVVVVADPELVEGPLRALNLGEVEVQAP